MPDHIDLHDTLEPAWLKEVAPDSTLNAKELMRMFNVCQATIYNKVKEGTFPPPDFSYLTYKEFDASRKTRRHRNQWKVSTIRKFFKQGETRCR